MNTPVCDFIKEYADKDTLRLHMPGHKGKSHLGFEKYDITEITGADSLYHANGIIRQSEENASYIFGSGKTLYSTEGSSHCVRAMLYLARAYSGSDYVLAGRNAHSSFISACVLNDLDVEWIYPKENESYLSCTVTPRDLEKVLSRVDKVPACVYITSPDYLGNMCDIASLARVCNAHGTLLLVDNAHGAYLKFLKEDLHPISLGAHLCCDSAHKTLPVLTGGAYLHVSKNAPVFFAENAKDALSLFGSTSPSYLTLASLDNANRYISEGFSEKLNDFTECLKKHLDSCAFCVSSTRLSIREPMKIALETKKIGHRGKDFAKFLEKRGVICEFFDDDYVVLMPSVENGIKELDRLFEILNSAEAKEPIISKEMLLIPPKKVMTPKQAAFSPREKVSIDQVLGRVLAISSVSCPPAVSLIVCGEEFNESTVALCKKYGFSEFFVIK